MAKRFVSIWFPQLATDWFSLLQPERRKLPFVLTLSSHGRKVITATNLIAKQNGIHIGMVLADAKALVPTLQVADDRPGLPAQLTQRIAEWCIRFTPYAAPCEPDGVMLDVSGCTHLWGGDEAYLTDILKRIHAKGYAAKAAIADTIGAAWAVARFHPSLTVVATGGQADALGYLPPAALRLESNIVDKLNKLGLVQVKDFISLPRPSLRRRFGAGILQRIDQALGIIEENIQPVYPLEPYSERLPCPEPIITRKGIEIGLERLLQTLCDRLRKESKGLRAAYFRVYRTDSSTQGIEISTSRPSHNEQHLFRLFELKISTIAPGMGIELFVLEATKVEEHQSRQESFWKGEGGLQDGELAELIDRLAGKFGAAAISRYLPAEHWWPERSIIKTALLTEQPATPWRSDKRRPLQLLPKPQPIEVTAPIPDYPPMNFRYNGSLHKVVAADGPERIEQEWWIGEGEHRDYYCVEDEAGCRYWIFRSGHYDATKTHQWYLHGFSA